MASVQDGIFDFMETAHGKDDQADHLRGFESPGRMAHAGHGIRPAGLRLFDFSPQERKQTNE